VTSTYIRRLKITSETELSRASWSNLVYSTRTDTSHVVVLIKYEICNSAKIKENLAIKEEVPIVYCREKRSQNWLFVLLEETNLGGHNLKLRFFHTLGVLISHPWLHAQLVHTLVRFESLHCPVKCGHHMLVHGHEIIEGILQNVPSRYTYT